MKSIWIFLMVTVTAVLIACQKSGDSTDRGAEASADSLDRSIQPPPGKPPESSFPNYDTTRLDNGLTLYVIESDRQPTVTYRLMFRSGSLYDGTKPGLAEFVADMLDKGVEGKGAFELASEIDFIGASLSASASSDFMAVSVSGLSRYKKRLLEILNEVVRKPTFPEQELEKLKERALSNLVSERSDPDALVEKLRRKLVYGEGGYGSYQTEESVASITREDLIAFHKEHFLPNNASLAIVGDLSTEESLALSRQELGGWESGNIPSLPRWFAPEVEGLSIHLLDRKDSVQSTLRVVQQSVPKSNPDTIELRVVMSVLGGGFSGRLFQNLREDKGYTYGAGSYAANAAKMGAIVSYADVRNEVTADAAKEILHEINRIREELIPLSELEMHKKYLAGNYMLSLESALTIAQRVQEIDVYDLPADYYQSYVSEILSVSPDEALKLAQRHLTPNDSVVVVVGKREAIEESLLELGEVTVYNEKLEVVD